MVTPRFSAIGRSGRVVNAAHDLGLPHGGDIGLVPKRGNARIGHADGAHRAGLGLRLQRQHGGVRDMPAGPVLRPADAVNAMLHGERHQPVIGGMELHLVDAPPETVESLKLGRIAVRILAPLQRLLRSCRRTQRQQRRLDPFAAESPGGIAQCRVRRVKIPARQWRRHVRHFMGFELRLRSVGCHDRASWPSGGGNSNTVRPGSEPRIGGPRREGRRFHRRQIVFPVFAQAQNRSGERPRAPGTSFPQA